MRRLDDNTLLKLILQHRVCLNVEDCLCLKLVANTSKCLPLSSSIENKISAVKYNNVRHDHQILLVAMIFLFNSLKIGVS